MTQSYDIEINDLVADNSDLKEQVLGLAAPLTGALADSVIENECDSIL